MWSGWPRLQAWLFVFPCPVVHASRSWFLAKLEPRMHGIFTLVDLFSNHPAATRLTASCLCREVQRILMELLNQMDGFDQTVNVKVIMATNRADTLDPALLRPGRLDRKIEFPLPDRRQKRLVFQVCKTNALLLRPNSSLFSSHLLACLCPAPSWLEATAFALFQCNRSSLAMLHALSMQICNLLMATKGSISARATVYWHKLRPDRRGGSSACRPAHQR